MNRATDALRATPRWVLVAAASGLLVAGVAGVMTFGGDDESLTTVEPAATTLPESPTTWPAAGPASGPSTTATVTTTTTTPRDPIDVDGAYTGDTPPNQAALVARPIPSGSPANPPTAATPAPWAESTVTTPGGLATPVGCAGNLNASGLDAFFAERVGPVMGWDYQHVVPLGGDRYLWLFQDAFLDHSGAATTLDQASFVHNVALVQDGRCFTLLHQGDADRPSDFEPGDGRGSTATKWFWPMSGDTADGTTWVFWVEMVKDPVDPAPGDGLGWHPTRTWLASYDATTLERKAFVPAPNDGVAPIYGYAVDTDVHHTYLFGNTFAHNLALEGGFAQMPHSGTQMWLARIPRFEFTERPEYRTADGWSNDPADAAPIVDRFQIENPMQPRLLGDQWVSATAVDGFWGNSMVIDVAEHPWGPWYPVDYTVVQPRTGDPLMNTYHAHLLPWRDGYGSVQIVISNNARDMAADAWPAPWRYRPSALYRPYAATPRPRPQPTPPPGTTTTTTVPPASTPPPTAEPTTTPPTTTTTVPPSTTSTTVPPSTTSTTVPPSAPTTTLPPPTPTPAPPTTAPALASAPTDPGGPEEPSS